MREGIVTLMKNIGSCPSLSDDWFIETSLKSYCRCHKYYECYCKYKHYSQKFFTSSLIMSISVEVLFGTDGPFEIYAKENLTESEDEANLLMRWDFTY